MQAKKNQCSKNVGSISTYIYIFTTKVSMHKNRFYCYRILNIILNTFGIYNKNKTFYMNLLAMSCSVYMRIYIELCRWLFNFYVKK
jgi:hypothetical protein